MTSSPAEPRTWTAGRWWVVIAIVFGIQIALFQLLLDRSPVVPRKAAVAPAFHLGNPAPRDWMTLEDPTLFALPHDQSFSGGAWLRVPPLEFSPSDWSEPVRLLSLPVVELGARFADFVQTNVAPPFPTIVTHEPKLTLPELASAGPVLIPSSLHIEGDLAKRRLLSHFILPAQTSSDLLTNSIVQLLVDAQGNTVSAALLPPGSSSTNADRCALDLAKAARFEPVTAAAVSPRDPSAGLTIGRMVFQWQTLPLSTTNTSSSGP